MSSSFCIHTKRRGSRVLVKLSGDFDGSDALMLANALKTYCRCGLSIHIDTDGLVKIHPFGLQCFLQECARYNLFDRITFTNDREGSKDSTTTPLKTNRRLFREYHAHDIGTFG